MGMFDMFKPAPQQAAPQAAPQVEAGNLQDPSVLANANSQLPNSAPNAASPASTPANTPMGDFATLWDTVKTDPSKQGNAPAALDQAELTALINKQSYANTVTPDMLASFPEEQHAALTSVMEAVARNVMVQATLVNNKLNAQSLTAAEAKFAAQLPDLLRAQSVANHGAETNPLFNNPAIKPVVEATRSQLLAKFPNATQAEITSMTEKYIMSMGAAFAPPPVIPTGMQEQDFSNFLDKGTVG
jgi:hypothetical protein